MALPVAIIVSVTICLGIYLLLQYAFMFYMSHDSLGGQHIIEGYVPLAILFVFSILSL
ncbi:MAG TPA: hypothetical protein DD381_11595 [Lentisphaeria bacterium]|nr:hypothetical protein [Lentisphaeria bacterium]